LGFEKIPNKPQKREKKWEKRARVNHLYSGYEKALRVTKDKHKTHIPFKKLFPHVDIAS
jgi:hypothetical protein